MSGTSTKEPPDEPMPEGSGRDLSGELPAARRDFYQRLRERVADYAGSKAGRADRFADVVLLAPDLFHLMVKLNLDSRVPWQVKARLVAVLTYFVLPIDLMPELLIGTAGFLDDVALGFSAIWAMLDEVDPAVLQEHWAGKEDVLETTRRVVDRTQGVLRRRNPFGPAWRLVEKAMGKVDDYRTFRQQDMDRESNPERDDAEASDGNSGGRT